MFEFGSIYLQDTKQHSNTYDTQKISSVLIKDKYYQ